MILVDTSVWVDHLRHGNRMLVDALNNSQVLMHPFVLGEISLGQLKQRATILQAMSNLPTTQVATDSEVSHLIERHRLFGLGIGYIDAHLLTAVHLTPGSLLWTQDKRLLTVSHKLGIAYSIQKS
jgi:predicted nucleic acid-binding protein